MELRETEDAVLQVQVWATGSNNLGGSGIRYREVRINYPWLQGGAEAVLPIQDTTRGTDPLFFDDLRLEYVARDPWSPSIHGLLHILVDPDTCLVKENPWVG